MVNGAMLDTFLNNKLENSLSLLNNWVLNVIQTYFNATNYKLIYNLKIIW